MTTTSNQESERELPLRITLVRPPADVWFRMQVGRTDLLAPSIVSPEALVFDCRVRAAGRTASGRPRLLGDIVQGPPDARFVYVNSGQRAGQQTSCWNRRAKVPLGGITLAAIEQVLASPDLMLVAEIEGTGRGGGPACASVPLRSGGWRVARREPD